MSARRKTFLYELMQPEFQRTFASMTGNTAFFETSKEGLDELLDTLPDGTNVERKQVVETAFSLVGKISYVFGGKYNRLGWNNEVTPTRRWAKRSESRAMKDSIAAGL